MIRKEKFYPGEYYHIYSRTILNNPEFKNYKNAERLKQAFLIANSTKSTEAFQFLRNNKDVYIQDVLKILDGGKKFVDILCYTIMPDHYHLLIRENMEDGIVNFVRKCNTSIAKYINIKNDRMGPLFESRFKAKHIDSNIYLLHLSLYIHLNPLDILDDKSWRTGNLRNWESKIKNLINYPWSSLKTYLISNHDDYIISGIKIIKEQFDSKSDYESFLRDWSENSLVKIDNIIID